MGVCLQHRVRSLIRESAAGLGGGPVVVQEGLAPPELVVLADGFGKQRGNRRVIGHHETRHPMRRLDKRGALG